MQITGQTNELEIIERANGTIEIGGYAACWHNPADPNTELSLGGNRVERIAEDTFDDCLKQNVVARFNHSQDYELGTTEDGALRLWKDSKGLRFSLSFDKDDLDHQKVATKIKKGLAKGCSFKGEGFTRWRCEGKQHIGYPKLATLEDISIVSRPAYKATAAFVRSADYEAEYKSWLEKEEATKKMIEWIDTL